MEGFVESSWRNIDVFLVQNVQKYEVDLKIKTWQIEFKNVIARWLGRTSFKSRIEVRLRLWVNIENLGWKLTESLELEILSIEDWQNFEFQRFCKFST